MGTGTSRSHDCTASTQTWHENLAVFVLDRVSPQDPPVPVPTVSGVWQIHKVNSQWTLGQVGVWITQDPTQKLHENHAISMLDPV